MQPARFSQVSLLDPFHDEGIFLTEVIYHEGIFMEAYRTVWAGTCESESFACFCVPK